MRNIVGHISGKGHFDKESCDKVIIGLSCKRAALIMLKNAIGANIPHLPASEIKAIVNPWPFQKSGLGIVGPLSLQLRRNSLLWPPIIFPSG